MSRTFIGVNDAKAVKRWRTALAAMTSSMEYFRKFESASDNTVIQRLTELESAPGELISFDLIVDLREDVIEGDNVAEGREEGLKYHSDTMYIDQVRKPVSLGGRMSRKRTLHDIRRQARDRTAEYMAQWFDELKFVYLSGDVGLTAINADSRVRRAFAGNSIVAPDSDHLMYGGTATSKATVAATHVMGVDTVEKALTRAKMMRMVNRDLVTMKPVQMGSKGRYILLISPFQSYSLRTSTGELSWVAYQQAAAGADGQNSPLFKDKLGMIADVVIHEHPSVLIFNDYGVGGDVGAARALFLGRQAGVIAYGMTGASRMFWKEQEKDFGNEVAISCGSIAGFKKTRFDGHDLAVMAIDTAAKMPA